MASPPDFETVSDYILSKIDIQVSGACGPEREKPIDCYLPIHQAYKNRAGKCAPIDHCMAAVIPGAVPRRVEGHDGLVYDRDIITTWRLPSTMSAYEEKEFERALGRNTTLVVLEAFYDAEPDLHNCDAFDVMRMFRAFIDQLGTHMVSITASSVVYDMETSFRRMKSQIEIPTEPFAWEEPHLLRTLHEFVLTRECWYYAEDREPALEVTFGVTGGRGRRRQNSDNIVLHFHYGWNPPTVGFENLQNVVLESTDFVLRPKISTFRPFSEMPRLEIKYYLGPTQESSSNWLQWDEFNACFRGIMPYSIAPALGAQRLDSYTLPLELTTKISQRFPGNIYFETIMRCALPLTVKRQPDECYSRFRPMEPLPSPLKSMLPSIIPTPGPLNVQVRMVRDITLDSDVKSGSLNHKRPWSRCSSQHADPQPATPQREPNTPCTALKFNRRGDLSSDSDGGSPDPTPRAVSIILSPDKKNGSPRYDDFSSLGRPSTLSNERLGQGVSQSSNGGDENTLIRGPSSPCLCPMSPSQRFVIRPPSAEYKKRKGELQKHRDEVREPYKGFSGQEPRTTGMWRPDAHASGSDIEKLTTDEVEEWFHKTRSMRRAAQGSDIDKVMTDGIEQCFHETKSIRSAARESDNDKLTTENIEEWFRKTRSMRRAAWESESTSEGRGEAPLAESATKGAEMSESEVAMWQREIQRNYQESLACKGEDVMMMDAEAWSDKE